MVTTAKTLLKLVGVLFVPVWLAVPVEAVNISVTNTNDAGAGSLRAAIAASNLSVGTKDTITFAIGGPGFTISPETDLPATTDPLIIDGYTQAGSSSNTLANGNNAVVKIMLDGQFILGNGLPLLTSNSTIRGLSVVRCQNGVAIGPGAGNSNVVEGCFIGADATGDAAGFGNTSGVYISDGVGHRIGGTSPGARNVITANAEGITIDGSSSGNLILGNFIGPDVNGLTALNNQNYGMHLLNGTSANQIGSTATGARNVISGNNSSGVYIELGSANSIRGNFIGTDVTGTNALGNNLGILIGGANNTVGGTAAGAGNVIANSFDSGVTIGFFGDDSTTNNAIRGNAIFANAALGIDLGGPGNVNFNDAICDADTGPNLGQNFPVLTAASNTVNTTLIHGSLTSTSNTTYSVEFFANSACDASGYGQGEFFLGATNITTAANNCTASFRFASTNMAAQGQYVTATATDPNGNTSEYSACHRVDGPLIIACRNLTASLPAGVTNTVVNYPSPRFTGDCNGLGIAYSIPSGSIFPLGTYPVTVTITNAAGDYDSCNFTVTVFNNGIPTVVVNTNSAGAGSLAQALFSASSGSGANLVLFNIPGPGPHTIIGGQFVQGGADFVVDGYSQPGASPNTLATGNNAVLKIELKGDNSQPNVAGFLFAFGNENIVLRGLAINGSTHSAVVFFDNSSSNNVVEGCFLGTDVTGTLARPNLRRGVQHDAGAANRIGGVLPESRNVISGNTDDGILMDGGSGIVVQGNYIGTQKDGVTPLPNGGSGIDIESVNPGLVGGNCPAAANVIANNKTGIYLFGGTNTLGLAFLGNSIYRNGTNTNLSLIGIDLVGTVGVTTNDATDADTGPNGLQNFPVLTSAAGSCVTTITGSLTSKANTTYRLEFFASAACNASGFGEGQTYLGSTNVTTTGAGTAAFTVTLPILLPANQTNITATATDPGQSTSEFSQCRTATITTCAGDTDGDGLPDSWELQYFGNLTQTGTGDGDGDGQNNLAEFLSGTVPTNSASLFAITAIARESNNIRVTWMTGTGRTNALDRTAGASGSYATNNFAAIFTATNIVGTVTNYLDIGAATNAPSRYYRVRFVP